MTFQIIVPKLKLVHQIWMASGGVTSFHGNCVTRGISIAATGTSDTIRPMMKDRCEGLVGLGVMETNNPNGTKRWYELN